MLMYVLNAPQTLYLQYSWNNEWGSITSCCLDHSQLLLLCFISNWNSSACRVVKQLMSLRQIDEVSCVLVHIQIWVCCLLKARHTKKCFFSMSGWWCFKPILSNPFTCEARAETELLLRAPVYVTTTHANGKIWPTCSAGAWFVFSWSLRVCVFLLSACMWAFESYSLRKWLRVWSSLGFCSVLFLNVWNEGYVSGLIWTMQAAL